MNKPTNTYEALVLSLKLILTATSDEQMKKATDMAETLANSLSPPELERAMLEVDSEMKEAESEHGMTGLRNAAKEVTKSSRLEIRCTPQEKAIWVHAAKGMKLAEWVTDALNDAAEKRPPI